jgi:hypothetical protein
MDAHPTALLIDRPQIYSSLYDLAAVVFGSEGLAKQSTGGDHDEFDKLRVQHEVGQATKLLIEIAVILRNLLDGERWPLDVIHEMRVEGRTEEPVGVLRAEGVSDAALAFREASNKLIHAQRISFGMQDLAGKMSFLNGIVELRGTKGKQNWVAQIDLSKFTLRRLNLPDNGSFREDATLALGRLWAGCDRLLSANKVPPLDHVSSNDCLQP